MNKTLMELAASVKQSSPEATLPEPSVATTKLEPTSKESKWDALRAVEKTLNKQFNTPSSLVRLGDKVGQLMPSYPTGISTLDYDVIQTGGVPKGRIIEVYGPESGGKTSLCLQIVKQEQAAGGICAYVDAEHALDPNYMEQLGVNVDELVVSQPDSGEQALETVEALIDSRAVSLIVVDSVAALVPQVELNGEMGDAVMGAQARLMSQACRKLRGKCSINGVTIIFINQIRMSIGVMFGNPETTTGGKALKFYASVRLDVRRVGGDAGKIMSGTNAIGHKMKIRAVKNKVGTPVRETIVDLIYGQGVDTFSDLVAYAVKVGALQKSGAWLKFNGENVGNGMDKTVAALRDNPELMGKVKAEVEKALAAQRET